MGSKIEYVESSQIYAAKYVRNSKAVGVLWGIFTICYAIISAVAFLTPEWISGSSESDNPARFGLWNTCYLDSNTEGTEDCYKHIDSFLTFPLSPLKIAAIFGAISVLLSIFTVLTLLLFSFCTSTTVYRICGWMQIVSAFSFVTSVTVYPLGWNLDIIRKTCGSFSDAYNAGDCRIGWAYYLAVISCLDAIVLATLAFILAARHIKLQPEPLYGNNGSLYKGEINSAYIGDTGSIAGSRKSLNLHQVLRMPQPMTEIDRFSEISARTGRSKISTYRPDYMSNVQNFQL